MTHNTTTRRKNKMRKNIEKTIANAIFCTLVLVTFAAIIFAFVSFGVMVETWEISAIPLIIFLSCSAWLVAVAVFIKKA